MELARRQVLAGLGAALTSPALAIEPARTLPPAAMRADLRLLRDAYETLHPGLYRYSIPREIGRRFEALADRCGAPRSLGDFYLDLSRLLASVRCGHSYANFYNQKKAVAAALFDGGGRLPLQFLWLGGEMVVTADPYATGIAPGSVIEAIDGRGSRALLAALMPLARADGHNDAKRRRLLSVQGEDDYETFDVFFGLLTGARDRYALRVRDPAGRRRTASVRAISLAERRAKRIAGDARGDQPIWTIERRGDAAVLTMPSWALYDSKWDWRAWLDAKLDALVADRVGTLVVDLRGNEGGEDCGNLILARIAERPIPLDPARRLVRYRELPQRFAPYCDTWDRSFDRLGVGAPRVDERFFELVGTDRDGEVIAPKGPRFTGRLHVLIGPQNSSATFVFAQAVQRNRLGTLIGEPTGGNRRGINGGCFYFTRLPETGLEADLPLIGNFPKTPQPDAGLVPDLLVAPTPASLAAGVDPAVMKALA
jgi:hypothetical protein